MSSSAAEGIRAGMRRRAGIGAVAALVLLAALVLVGRWEGGRGADEQVRGMERVRALVGPLDSPTLSGYRELPGVDCLVYRRGSNPFALELCVDPQGRVVETVDRRRYDRAISSLRYDPSASTLRVHRGEVDRLLRKMGAS